MARREALICTVPDSEGGPVRVLAGEKWVSFMTPSVWRRWRPGWKLMHPEYVEVTPDESKARWFYPSVRFTIDAVAKAGRNNVGLSLGRRHSIRYLPFSSVHLVLIAWDAREEGALGPMRVSA